MVRPLYGESLLVAEYKGTYDLSLENFPYVAGIYQDKYGNRSSEEGYESNIFTGMADVDVDGGKKYVVYPQLFQGEEIEDPHAAVKAGKHFGFYDTQEEAQEADDAIHAHFKMLNAVSRLPEDERTILEVFGDKSQSSDNVKGFLKGLIGNR